MHSHKKATAVTIAAGPLVDMGTDLFPTRYLTIPYESDENGVLTSLKPEWDVQEEEEV